MISLSANKLVKSINQLSKSSTIDLLFMGCFKNDKNLVDGLDSNLIESLERAIKIDNFDGSKGKKVLIYGS